MDLSFLGFLRETLGNPALLVTTIFKSFMEEPWWRLTWLLMM